MNVRDDKRWGPLDERTVANFETRNGIELPADYRAFLLAHHGGVPDPNFYWVVDGDWGSGIESFYGFGQDGYLLQQYLDGRESIGVAKDLLAIGDDGCCSLLAIGIVGPCRGQVFYIDHEFVPSVPKHVCFLASSFTEFLERLCVDPDY
ncbi:MAG: hypothetical protein FD138_1705 [Planctomycetota bacterium]|nr:MAG: hypothetical protein FD138_1705 [Planctomycetota bacterium]